MSVNYSRDKSDDKQVRKELNQIRPLVANTPEEIYAPDDNIEATIVMIAVVNDTNQDITLNAYHDKDGTTYNDDTRVAQRVVSKGAESNKEGLFLTMNGQGSFAVESSTAGGLTFTIWGIERPKK